jgi:Fe-S-cluster containining protein
MAALEGLWTEWERELADEAATCRACGQCCDFPRQGHVLFATKGELDVCLDWSRRHVACDAREYRRRLDAGLCPFQESARCLVHAVRPLGCRIFFCRPHDAAGLDRTAAEAHRRLQRALRGKELLQWYGPALAYFGVALSLSGQAI